MATVYERGPAMITTAFIIGVTVVVIAYDVWAYLTPERTISQVMAGFAKRHPVIILLWGVLMGHWFWGMCI